MIVECPGNVKVEITQRHKDCKAYYQKNVCGDNRAVVAYWHDPFLGGWRWSIDVSELYRPKEILVRGVICDNVEQCVIAANDVIQTEHFRKMLSLWRAESL